MKRRSLLSLLAAAGVSAPAVLAGRSRAGTTPPSRHVLVLVELRGGNDGLNTVVPHRDPAYRQARPSLALADPLPLTEDLALHPALAPLLPMWRQQRLAFALGVGWPEPNRSHFKASDQWSTANPAGTGPGWLARAYGLQAGAGPLVSLGPSGCPAMEGGEALALQLAPGRLQDGGSAVLDPAAAGDSPVLRRLLELELAGNRELERLRRQLAPLPAALVVPRGSLGQQVALALRLIGSEGCPPVLQLAQAGYDTHANQAGRHSRALADLAEALAALDAGLQQLARRPRVTVLAVSEFGRRLQENGSRGTDHGSASIALIGGDAAPHPFLGRYPRLDRLDGRGDLIPTLSPLQLYRQVLAEVAPETVRGLPAS
jgi:uncharacterized protein (DUF1501 family)